MDQARRAIEKRLDHELDPPMFEGKLVVIMPTKGHPDHIPAVLDAWRATHAPDDGAVLVLATDATDDSAALVEYSRYATVEPWVWLVEHERAGYGPVANAGSRWAVSEGARYVAVQNDDHLPRTDHWAQAYAVHLGLGEAERGCAVVFGDDLLRGSRLCTEWATTASWVRVLGRMIPCLAQHQYTDTSVRDLARSAGVLRYLGERPTPLADGSMIGPVVIEHMHPTAGKRPWSATTAAANSPERIDTDRRIFERWRQRPADSRAAGLAGQVRLLRSLDSSRRGEVVR